MKFSVVIVSCAMLSGCMVGGSLTMSTRDANFGAPISQSDCQALAKRHIAPYLRSPATARYKFSKCRPDTARAKPWLRLPRQSGYAIKVAVNAQNQWGNYIGYRDYEILIRDGQVIRRLRETQKPGVMERY